MYCWTLLSRDIAATPYLMGITEDLATAKRQCEPHLKSRQAFLGYVEAVEPAVTAHGLDVCYVRTGPAWLGRLSSAGGVGWREQAARASHVCFVRTGPAWLGRLSSAGGVGWREQAARAGKLREG